MPQPSGSLFNYIYEISPLLNPLENLLKLNFLTQTFQLITFPSTHTYLDHLLTILLNNAFVNLAH